MTSRTALALTLLALALTAACQSSSTTPEPAPAATVGPMTVEAEGYTLQLYIDKPAADVLDLIVAYHGTIRRDHEMPGAAARMATSTRAIVSAPNVAIISVAYPQQGRLIGQSMPEAEAALRWCQQQAPGALGFRLRRLFLVGHSQGGYVVTRLATRFATDGVVANAPGPLDLGYRCTLEASGQVAPIADICQTMQARFGTPTQNPAAYAERSLLAFTRGYRSEVLFVQGLDDSPIQLASWARFRDSVSACADCRPRSFLDLAGYGHGALFDSPEAQQAFNRFLQR